MSALTYVEIVNALVRDYGLPRENAERAAKLTLAESALATSAVAAGRVDGAPRTLSADELGKIEKEIEHAGDKLALSLGGRIVKFSHPGRTKQTPGIADRLYLFPRHRLAVWWEWKAPDGAQRPDQRVFEEDVTSCGQEYGLGGLGDFRAWLMAHRVAAFDEHGNPSPYPES